MNKTIAQALLLTLILSSCHLYKKETNHLEVAQKYYQILGGSDNANIHTILSDSIIVRENEYDYQETFSQKGYEEWLKWDAAFEPQYKVLEIVEEDNHVKAKVSKIDKRLLFLHKDHIVWTEIIHFDSNKIVKVERTEYLTFNDSVFTQNRSLLLNWIDQNHPELNGFIYDQTEAGSHNYLKAIELYNTKCIAK